MLSRSVCRALLWMVAAVFIVSASAGAVAAQEQDPSSAPFVVPNPGADLWRAVRQRETGGELSGTTQVRGVETGVLISKAGEEFREFRRQRLLTGSAWLIGAAAIGILVFYLIRGRIPVPGGPSGTKIRRFHNYERLLHWLTATVFIVLGLTGLNLMFGRFVVLPVIGPDAFGVLSNLSKQVHNILGPLFILAVVLLTIRFAARNLPSRHDVKWLIKGGGIIGNAHVSAGFFNAGEKIWFWSVVMLGLIVSISGLVLYFPIFGQGREILQLALVVHGIASVLFIAGSFGHIYIGTIGTEGSLQSMTTGYVDENWARAHHDIWYEEVVGNGQGTSSRDRREPSDSPSLRASPPGAEQTR